MRFVFLQQKIITKGESLVRHEGSSQGSEQKLRGIVVNGLYFWCLDESAILNSMKEMKDGCITMKQLKVLGSKTSNGLK